MKITPSCLRNVEPPLCLLRNSLLFILFLVGSYSLCLPNSVLALDQPSIEEMDSVFKQLSPSPWPTNDLASVKTPMVLPTRSVSKDKINTAEKWLKQFTPMPMEDDPDADESITFGYVIRDLRENDDWRIMEMGFEISGETRGVLLAENKNTNKWTAFYNIPSDRLEGLLHLNGNFKLTGNTLSGSFCINDCEGGWENWGNIEIALNNFILKPAVRHRLSDYPVKSLYNGPATALQLDSDEYASHFETRIRDTLAEGVNFSGQYVVTQVGCGTECQVFIAVDARTGKVVGTVGARAGALYTADSRLLIINTEPYCITTDLCSPSYYLIENDALVELK